jgi:adenylyltransferase/sulfurtransferase
LNKRKSKNPKAKSKMHTNKQELFKRQIALSEIGEHGQQKLQNARVLVVGCGGLGSPIAVHLAASGIGSIHLIDFDTVALSNLHRQVFYALEDVGKPKVVVLSAFIKKRAPFTAVQYTNAPLTKATVFKLISEVDIVIDGTDSLPTKYLLNDACVLKNKPLVYGSLYKYDGYVASFNIKQSDGTFSGNLRDAFPKIATDVPNCEEAGTLNAIVSLIAAQQINEVLKLITAIGKPLTNELLIYNSLQNSQFKMKFQNSISKEEIQQLFEKESYIAASCEFQNPDWFITADGLKTALLGRAKSRPIVISVLANLDTPFKVDRVIPMQQLNMDTFQMDVSKTYVLVCQRGITSYKATILLKEKFPQLTIVSLSGGINDYLNSIHK